MADVIIYKAKDGCIEFTVNLSEETVWLSLTQIAALFGRDKSVISRHLSNIFKNNEPDRNQTVANFATTATDGKIYQVDYYNPGAIISIGYRVNSLDAYSGDSAYSFHWYSPIHSILIRPLIPVLFANNIS